jgi:hypothetical protein
MSQEEFAEQIRLYRSGSISRRAFLNRAVAGGLTVAAASAFLAAAAPAQATPDVPGKTYGRDDFLHDLDHIADHHIGDHAGSEFGRKPKHP